MSKNTLCPKCAKVLIIEETEWVTGNYDTRVIFTCRSCGHFLGISPYVPEVETQLQNIESDVEKLQKTVEKLIAALPANKEKQ